MSSVGQIVGAVVGVGLAIIFPPAGGLTLGFVMTAASLGSFVGGLIDPPAGPNVEGPRINDRNVIASTYGQTIPLLYGEQNRISGNVIWSTGLLETANEEDSGGKGGGGGGSQTTYTYRLSCAMAFAQGEIAGITRIWANSKLIFDIGDLTTPEPVMDPAYGQVFTKANGTHAAMEEIRLYVGNTTQLPDSWVESHVGAGQTPAYRGTAYIVLKDLQLADFGNRLPNIEVEVKGINKSSVGGIAHDVMRRSGVPNASVPNLTDVVRGFAITNAGAAENALAPLTSAYYFDVAEQAGQARCVRRGLGMKGTIPLRHMGARDPSTNGGAEPITYRNVNALELPKQVAVTYSDPESDFQPNTQVSFREVGNAENNTNIQLGIVLDADRARQIADRLLWEQWASRKAANFKVSNRWARLQAGDLYGVEVGNEIVPYKVIRSTRGDNGLYDVDVQRDDAVVYNSTAFGIAADIPENRVMLPGVTQFFPMDIPILRDTDDNTGFYWAVTAVERGWRGASIMRSSDLGVSYALMSNVAVRARVGRVAAATPSGPTDFWDEGNTIDVTLEYEQDTLESRDDLSVLNGANAAYLGNANGQGGEIIQFRTATLIGVRQYRLSGLLRGRLGTEANVSTHGTNEVFVLLQTNPVGRSDYGAGDFDKARLFKPVSTLTSMDDTAAQTFTNTGVGKKPLSGVHVMGSRDTSNNLTVNWTRRTRYRVPGLGAGPVPLGEETESYEIDVFTGSTVVRTITSTTPTFTYTAAQQTADGKTPGNPVIIRIYQMSSVRGRGFPAIATV